MFRIAQLTCFSALLLVAALPRTNAAAQDIEIAVGRINKPTVGYRFVAFPQVQIGIRVASFTRDNHPLRLAAHWGTWKDKRDERRGTLIGVRMIQTTSTGRLQPQLVVGFGYRFSPYYERLPYIEAGINAGVQISPRVIAVVGLARYHPLASMDDPDIRQLAVRIGLAVGSFR